MSNPYTKENGIDQAEQMCKLANERFGYKFALELALTHAGYSAMKTKFMLEQAGDRYLDSFEAQLKDGLT